MNTRKKVGILLILIGIGIPVVLYFFQDDGVMWTIDTHKQFQRNLDPDEVAALHNIAILKKELGDLFPFITRRAFSEDKYPKPPDGYIHETQFLNKLADYEMKLIPLIKTAYAENHFENEAWDIDTWKQFVIPYRQVVGVGVFLTLTGLGFLIFSIIPKKP